MSGQDTGWANPGPAGLVALAVACFTFFALLTGKVDPGAFPLLGCWLLGGFVVQLIVGVIELREGQVTGGNVFTFFCAFFMLVGGLEFFVKYFAAANAWSIPLNTLIDGYAWAALAIAIVLWTPAYFKAPLILSIAVVILDVGVVLVALTDLQLIDKAVFSPIAGWALLFAGILGLYVASAIVLNTAYGKSILPMPGPISK